MADLNKVKFEKTEVEKGKKISTLVNGRKMHTITNDGVVSIEDRSRKLYHLQLTLSKMDGIETFRGEIPFEVQDLKDEVSGLSIRIENLQKSLLDCQKQIGQEKIKITNADALVEKYKKQIDKVRNNREYDSLSKEIENQELDIQLAEKHIRTFSEKVRMIEEEIQNNKQIFKERQIDLESKENELENVIEETNVQEKKLEKQVKQIEACIDPHLLIFFNKLRKNMKNGLAVVCVQRNACGGCFNKIPPQRRMEIKMKKKMVTCEYCGRIVVDEEPKEEIE